LDFEVEDEGCFWFWYRVEGVWVVALRWRSEWVLGGEIGRVFDLAIMAIFEIWYTKLVDAIIDIDIESLKDREIYIKWDFFVTH